MHGCNAPFPANAPLPQLNAHVLCGKFRHDAMVLFQPRRCLVSCHAKSTNVQHQPQRIETSDGLLCSTATMLQQAQPRQACKLIPCSSCGCQRCQPHTRSEGLPPRCIQGGQQQVAWR